MEKERERENNIYNFPIPGFIQTDNNPKLHKAISRRPFSYFYTFILSYAIIFHFHFLFLTRLLILYENNCRKEMTTLKKVLSDKWINYILNINNTKEIKCIAYYTPENTKEWCAVRIKSSILNGLYINYFHISHIQNKIYRFDIILINVNYSVFFSCYALRCVYL